MRLSVDGQGDHHGSPRVNGNGNEPYYTPASQGVDIPLPGDVSRRRSIPMAPCALDMPVLAAMRRPVKNTCCPGKKHTQLCDRFCRRLTIFASQFCLAQDRKRSWAGR
jgi:hypothetical protein